LIGGAVVVVVAIVVALIVVSVSGGDSSSTELAAGMLFSSPAWADTVPDGTSSASTIPCWPPMAKPSTPKTAVKAAISTAVRMYPPMCNSIAIA
jgi:hypothetical protein